MYLITILLLLTALPLIAYADDTKTVTVVYLYEEGCHRCTEVMPVVRQAIEETRGEGLSVDYQEIRVNSQKGTSYVDRYSLIDIPDLIIDNHTIIGPANLDGDYVTILRNIKDTIASSYGYAPPVTVHTTAVKKSGNDNNVTVTVYLLNQGNAPINVSLSGGLTEGSRLVSGLFFWSGPLQPDAEEKVTYVLSGGNTSCVSPSTVYYEDNCGRHVITDSYISVGTMPMISVPIAFVSGIVAAFSPCSLAVITYMATLAVSSERRYLLLINVMSFSVGLLFTYSLIGVCFYRLSVTMPSMYNVARYAIVISMLVIGSAMIIRTLFNYGRSFSDIGFKKFLALLQPYGKMSTASYSFAIGMGFSMIKMPCAGGPYLAILGIMADQSGSFHRLYYLLAYDAGVVLPVLCLGVLLSLGFSAHRLDTIRKQYRVVINVSTGITLFILAGLLAFNVI
ncbi:cytochrome c biogenesis CcdA family protein [Methanosarcina horonobensis]|uniref:cytochrome c biogenesis CcdA family protein n=1 Tax=Methanosarcina horonobensis TaxID=418008 RepID=UPI001EF70D6E|nr:cytochrome c biogenesis CcdA family protein [Methanosarcina horonobensis]